MRTNFGNPPNYLGIGPNLIMGLGLGLNVNPIPVLILTQSAQYSAVKLSEVQVYTFSWFYNLVPPFGGLAVFLFIC